MELKRFLKVVARLRWKLPLLNMAYEKAGNRLGLSHEDIIAQEAQFKVDFHEFYALIERGLVHLMGVFDIRVTGLAGSVKTPLGLRQHHDSMLRVPEGPKRAGLADSVHNPAGANIERHQFTQISSTMAVRGRHQFHENVLRALEDPENPLYVVFGSSEVFRQLARAKELRNRWKTADEYTDEKGNAPVPLGAYNLEHILGTILNAFEHGYEVARSYVESLAGAGVLDLDSMSLDGDEDDNSMDWEAC